MKSITLFIYNVTCYVITLFIVYNRLPQCM